MSLKMHESNGESQHRFDLDRRRDRGKPKTNSPGEVAFNQNLARLRGDPLSLIGRAETEGISTRACLLIASRASISAGDSDSQTGQRWPLEGRASPGIRQFALLQ
jgi:hypothetical protein